MKRILLLALFAGSAEAQTIEYLFDENPSTTVLDSAGNHHASNVPGADNTAPIYGSGFSGTGLELDGDGDFLNLGDIPDMQRYTIMAWVRHLPPAAQTFVPTTAEEGPRQNNEVIEKIGEYWLNIRDNNQKVRAGGRFVDSANECTGGVSGIQITVDSAVPVEYGEWTHVAMSYSGNLLRVFVDGELSGQVATPPGKCDSQWPAVIGAKYSPFSYGPWPNGTVTNNFHGTMDCFKVFDAELSAAQIAAESEDCGAGPPPPDNPPDHLGGQVQGLQEIRTVKCINLATNARQNAQWNGSEWDCGSLPVQPGQRVRIVIVGTAE